METNFTLPFGGRKKRLEMVKMPKNKVQKLALCGTIDQKAIKCAPTPPYVSYHMAFLDISREKKNYQ